MFNIGGYIEMSNIIFDLEQKIMDCWSVVDDIETLYAQILDGDVEPTTDEISNVLLGMKQLYQYKFSQTFDKFEELCKEHGKLKQTMHNFDQHGYYRQSERQFDVEDLDPDKRSWYYDGNGVRRSKVDDSTPSS